MVKKQKLRVLSIDFDYFQVVDKDTVQSCYPDGIDLDTSLSTIVWASHYAIPSQKEKLDKVFCNQEELRLIQHILNNNCKATAPVCIANSHVHIYDFIHESMESFAATSVDVTNVDMHHDLFNDNPYLDCGNWLMHIHNEIQNTRISWVANPVSEEVYGFNDQLKSMVLNTLESIKDRKFDIVFLCRSDNWLPPHLDNEFQELVDFIVRKFKTIRIDPQVKKPRELEKFARLLSNQEHNQM